MDVIIIFEVGQPKFDLENYEPETLHCSLKGGSWKLALPGLENRGFSMEDVSISMERDESGIFEFDPNSMTVNLNKKVRS